MGKRQVTAAAVIAAFLMTVLPIGAYAGLFEQLAVSGAAASMGSAVTAYPPGALAIHYNPAGLSGIEGTRFDNGLVFTVSEREVEYTQAIDPQTGKLWAPFGGWFNNGIDPIAGTKGKLQSGYMVVPIIDYELPYLAGASMGVSHKVPGHDNRLTIGFAQYAPFGAGMKHHDDDPISFLGKSAWFVRFILAAPGIAYKLNDELSVGASVGLGVSMFNFSTNMRAPNTMVALTGALGEATENLEIPVLSELTLPPPWFNGGMNPYHKAGSLKLAVEDYFTTSYNLGLLWEPVPWFAFGACYQSGSETTMDGDFKMTYGSEFQRTVDYLGRSPLTVIIAGIFDLPTRSVPYQKGTASVSMEWPASWHFGIKLKPIKQVTLTCDAHWTQWSSWPELVIDFDQKLQFFRFVKLLGYTYGDKKMVVTMDYKNLWNFSYGLEIRPVKKVAIRLGLEDRPTSVRDDRFGPMPLADMMIYGAGISIDVEDKPKPKPDGIHGLLKQLQHPSTIELAYMLVDVKDKTVLNNTSTNLNSTEFTDIVYNPYAGLDWRQRYKIQGFFLNQVFRW